MGSTQRPAGKDRSLAILELEADTLDIQGFIEDIKDGTECMDGMANVRVISVRKKSISWRNNYECSSRAKTPAED